MSSCFPKTHKNPVVLRASMTSRFLLSKNSFTDNDGAADVLDFISSLLADLLVESFPSDEPNADTGSDAALLVVGLSVFSIVVALTAVRFLRCFLSFVFSVFCDSFCFNLR